MGVRGIRGATTVERDNEAEIVAATRELLEMLREANDFAPGELASIVFTTTSDVTAAFPAKAARQLGWLEVPMLCAGEIATPGGLERCIRVLLHWNTDKSPEDVHHIYLRNARQLRPDFVEQAQVVEASARAQRVAQEEAREAERIVTPSSEVGPVAFQGEPGAYSEEGINQWLGADVPTVPCEWFEDVLEAVNDGRAATAFLPVENSTSGSIHAVYDLDGNRIAEYDYDTATGTSTLIREYIWMNGVPVGVVEGGQV